MLHFTGYEIFQLPNRVEFIYIILNGILGLMFNGTFMLVIAFLGPVPAAIGILLTIPITTILDSFLTNIGINSIVGCCLICLGYSLLIYLTDGDTIEGDEGDINEHERLLA